MQVSTDYVFAGDATTPYAEDAQLAPRSAYGRTKAAGEWAVRALCPRSRVVRTAWLYGAGGPSFVSTMARLAAHATPWMSWTTSAASPTWTMDLSRILEALVTSGAPYGAYHATSSGETTWCGFAREIFSGLGLDPARVHPRRTEAFPRPAPRPAYSVLGHDAWHRAGLAPIRSWREALAEALPSIVAAG